MKTLLRLVIISRPVSCGVQAVMFAAGAFASKVHLSWAVALAAFLVSFPLGIVVYGLNDIADRESDEQNIRKGGADGAVIRQDEIKPVLFAASLCGTGGLIFFLTTGRLLTAAVWTFGCFLAYTYSIPPIRTKSRPVLDSLTNGLGALSVVLMGYWIGTQGLHIVWPPLYVMLAVVLGMIGIHAFATIVDYPVDKAAGDKTFAIALGKPITSLICASLFAICAVLLRNHLAYVLYGVTCSALCLLSVHYSDPRATRYIGGTMILLFPATFILRVLLG